MRRGNTLTRRRTQAPSQWNTARALPQVLPSQGGLPAFHIFDDSDDQPPSHSDCAAAENTEVRATPPGHLNASQITAP